MSTGGLPCGVTFRGGIASGRSMQGLGRLPTLVRVVEDTRGAKHDKPLDILNDLDDAPEEWERVAGIYVRDPSAPVFACTRGAGGGGGPFVTYVHLPVLGVEELRTEDRWISYLAVVFNTGEATVRAMREAERHGETFNMGGVLRDAS